jgi:hypothetical protein
MKMHNIQHVEELRALFARVDKLLPPHSEARREHIREPMFAAIQAKPTRVTRIQCSPFKGEIPALHQTQASRRAHAGKIYTANTCMTDTETLSNGELPPGVSLWYPTDHTGSILPLAKHDLRNLFHTPMKIPYDEERGFFSLPAGKQLCFRDSMILIHESYPYLRMLCLEYAKMVTYMYELPYDEFETNSRIFIQRHASKKGKAPSLSETLQARYDGGPVLIVCLELPNVSHDFLPTLPSPDNSHESGYRLNITEGFLTIIDGEARFRFSHGFPTGQSGGPFFFAISIFMDCIKQTQLAGYERETRTLIMSTPMKTEHVITTLPEQVSRVSHQFDTKGDTLGRLIQRMRMRIRSAESHVLTRAIIDGTPRK